MAAETDILIRTKLYRPQLTTDLVARPRLLQWLSQHRRRPLTLVSASAGYGKTTLISSWLEAVDGPSAWLSLDEYDDDLAGFLTYFIAAIQTIFPEAGRKTQGLLNASSLPPLPVLARSLISELELLTSPFILVLDDYHFTHEAVIHDLLRELLHHPPRAMHLVIITRRDPPLPIIKLRARAQVTEIRSQELRFTEAETALFLQQVGLQVDETTAGDLTRKTEGWITGLRLSALSLRQRGVEVPLTGAPENIHYVTDYLLSETLSQLPSGTKDFLIKTSILDRLCGPLCDAVTGRDEHERNGQVNLEWLHQQNLFIIPLDDQRQWFRYHRLFQELLRDQLKQRLVSNDVEELHRRASTWFADHNLIDQALRHSLAAGDVMGAAQLVEHNTYAILEDGRFPILGRWLNQLPEEIVQQRPGLLLARAWVSHFQGAFERVPPILQKIDKLLEAEPIEQGMAGDLDFFNAVLLFWDWQIEPSVELFHRAIERIAGTNVGGRNEAELYFACASQMAGQGDMVTRKYGQMLQEETSDGPRKGYLLGTLAFVHMLSGELAMVYEMARQMVAFGDRTDNAIVSGWGSYLMGYMDYEWNNLEAASHHFSQAVEKRYFMDVNSPIDSYAGLIFTYQAMQQSDKANETVKLMFEFAQQRNHPGPVILARSVQARLSLLQGDLQSASRWLEMADISADVSNMFLWLEQPGITRCRVLLGEGSETSLREATKKLHEYWQLCQATHNTPQMIEILLLQTLAHHKQEQFDKALAVLEHAVNLARPGRYIRPFVGIGPALAGYLEKLHSQDIAPNYIKQILGTFDNLRLEDEQIENPLVELLTNRELEVLELLSQRFSNKEIAAELFISPLTVKTHAINIYQKLGVKNRRQAVSKAISLGLVSKR